MWQSVGAQVDQMTPAQHDEILSAISHLPHMVAYTLVNYLGRRSDVDSIFDYAAGGFYDFTRMQLFEWGVKFHDLFLGKPAGDIYIDDKGYYFQSWKKTLKDINERL